VSAELDLDGIWDYIAERSGIDSAEDSFGSSTKDFLRLLRARGRSLRGGSRIWESAEVPNALILHGKRSHRTSILEQAAIANARWAAAGSESLARRGLSPPYEKNTPFRSWPISANELEDVPSASDSNTKSPTVALHCI